MKYRVLLLVLFIVLFLCGCGKNKEPHTTEQFMEYIDGLPYSLSDDSIYGNDNLKGKYKIIDDRFEKSTFSKDKNNRVMTVQLEGYDYTFEVTSKYGCLDGLHGGCFKPKYGLVNNFYTSENFFLEYYISIKNINVNREDGKFIVNDKGEVTTSIDFIEDYTEFLNSLKFKIEPKHIMLRSNNGYEYDFRIEYNKDNDKFEYYYLNSKNEQIKDKELINAIINGFLERKVLNEIKKELENIE